MPAAPGGEARGPRPPDRRLPADERRYGREVVGVGRVAQAEQHRDGHDDPKVVPSERLAIMSSSPNIAAPFRSRLAGARTVISETGDEDGDGAHGWQSPTSRPSKLVRRKTRLAQTAIRPMAVIVIARPMLNARRSRPKPCGAARSRPAGRRARTGTAAGRPRRHGEQRARREAVVVIVVMVVVVPVLVRAAVREPAGAPAPTRPPSARDEVEPRVEVLGNDELGEQQTSPRRARTLRPCGWTVTMPPRATAWRRSRAGR